MATLTVRIKETDHKALTELSKQMGKSMTAALSDAISELRRRHLLTRTNDAYAALKADPKAWRDEQDERAAWDATLSDGLDNL